MAIKDNVCTNEITFSGTETISFEEGRGADDSTIIFHDDEFSLDLQFDEGGEPYRENYDDETWASICEDKCIEPDFTPSPRKPVNWVNGAGIKVDKDSVSLKLSLSDPRGFLAMWAERLPDGRILLHVPREDEMHVKLVPVRDGVFEVKMP